MVTGESALCVEQESTVCTMDAGVDLPPSVSEGRHERIKMPMWYSRGATPVKLRLKHQQGTLLRGTHRN